MRHWAWILLLVAACGGGSGGGGGPNPPPPPVDPFADANNTGLAVATGFPNAVAIGTLVLFAVSESEMGTDLNSDGDSNDRVLHRLETATGAVVNMALAVVGAVIRSDRDFAFLVSEAGQGGTILNGDGDTADAVWHVFDPLTLSVANTGLATPAGGLAGAGTTGGFVLRESENAQGADLNGDGDTADIMATTFDGFTATVGIRVPHPVAPATEFVARNGRVLVARTEAGAGVDLNGDGDPLDVVLGAVNFLTGTPTFIDFTRAVANLPYVLTDDSAAYFIDEPSNGLDLNGDGDMQDAIVAVFNIAGGLGENLPFTGAAPGMAMAGAAIVGIGAGPQHIMVAISEASHYGMDLNADTDMFDSVLGWVDTQNAPQTMNLVPRAVGNLTPVMDGPRGVFVVREANEGIFQGTDSNGDGDDQDDVAFMLDASLGTVTNLAQAVATLQVVGDDALLGVSEAAQGLGPLNGDGDTNDVVLRYFNLAARSSINLAVVADFATIVRAAANDVHVAVILSEGQSPQFDDVDMDGDTADRALVLFSIDPAGPSVNAKTPEFNDIASFDSAPPLAAGAGIFVFATIEASVGEDRNGDADLLDTVLSYAAVR